jgi:hypothetical protein
MSTTRKTTSERIDHHKEKLEQMQNELKTLLNKQKAEERKARTHRICQRGGLIESLLPDTIMLNAERFKSFLDKTVANKFGRSILAELVNAQKKEDATETEGTAGMTG